MAILAILSQLAPNFCRLPPLLISATHVTRSSISHIYQCHSRYVLATGLVDSEGFDLAAVLYSKCESLQSIGVATLIAEEMPKNYSLAMDIVNYTCSTIHCTCT